MGNLGRARTAQVQRDARIGEAEARAEAAVRVLHICVWLSCHVTHQHRPALSNTPHLNVMSTGTEAIIPSNVYFTLKVIFICQFQTFIV